jgi:glycosyltransferase involved in cell wall biosynthesis
MVIANSDGVGQDVLKVARIPAEKLRVIRNATVTEELFRKALEPVDHPWFEEGEPPVITGLGRLARQKGFDVLLSAFALVRAERPCRLVIIGSGKERDNLGRLAGKLGVSDDLDLVGYDPNPFRYLKRARLFVLSSYWEGSPNALIEALALGVPVVATDCHSGPRDILCDGKYGALVPTGNAAELAEAIRRALDAQIPSAMLEEAALPFQARLSALAYIKTLYNA